MDIEKEIGHFMQSEDLHRYVKTALSIPGKENFPYQNYFAFNFEGDRIKNAKFYFSFYHKLEPNEYGQLLPTVKDFEHYFPYWKEQPHRDVNNTGCAFAIKINRDLVPTYQYHMRFPYSGLLTSPENITLSDYDLNFYQGISHEYTKDQVVEKKYYYLYGSPTVHSVLQDFDETFYDQLLEYTETDKWEKIIHWFDSTQLSKKYFKDNCGPVMNQFIDDVCEKYQCVPLFPGVYKDKSMRSVYFFRPNKFVDLVFKDLENNQIQTLPKTLFTEV